jgi:hypothetical protein
MRLAVRLLRKEHGCASAAQEVSMPADDDFKLPAKLELDRIISLQDAEKISSLSPDSWKRNHREKIVELSPRRYGIRLRDALKLSR